MARILVHEQGERSPVPFLRGILTHSLQGAGLPFEEAYALADKVRAELGQRETVTTDELRQVVMDHLNRDYPPEVVRRYQELLHPGEKVVVAHRGGRETRFSAIQHQRCLESCAITADEAAPITHKIHEHLLTRGRFNISSQELGYLTYRVLRRDLGEAAANRYLVWVDFIHSGRPLLLLIGGTSGSGKSTVATALANRMSIVRTQSTDMLREVMRMLLPERLLPVLHSSSFNAWQHMPEVKSQEEDSSAGLIQGYCSQAELLGVACEAVLQRAYTERVSIILEGVHVYPALLERIRDAGQNGDAIVLMVMLAVLKPEQLRGQIRGRGTQIPQRRAERYTEHFDQIWQLQSFLLDEADRHSVPIVSNEDLERSLREIKRTLITKLARERIPSPQQLFGLPAAKGETGQP